MCLIRLSQFRGPLHELFSIKLSEKTVDELEELLDVMTYMEGIRDGDRTHTLRWKAFNAMIIATTQFYAVELAEAMKLKICAQ